MCDGPQRDHQRSPKGFRGFSFPIPALKRTTGSLLNSKLQLLVKKLGFRKQRDLQRGGDSSSELSSLSATFTFPTKAPKGRESKRKKGELVIKCCN